MEIRGVIAAAAAVAVVRVDIIMINKSLFFISEDM